MALVLDATPGGSSSNTYCLLSEAEAYQETRVFNSAWVDAETTQKNSVLAWATRLLDQQDWKGWKSVESGALRWPQYGHFDRDGIAVTSTAIPQFLKEACAEWAFQLLIEDRTADEGGLVQYGGKIGPISDPDRYVRKVMPASVREMLGAYLKDGSGCEANVTVRRV